MAKETWTVPGSSQVLTYKLDQSRAIRHGIRLLLGKALRPLTGVQTVEAPRETRRQGPRSWEEPLICWAHCTFPSAGNAPGLQLVLRKFPS